MLGHFSPGPEPTIFRVGGARIGVLICYEGFYERLARRYRLAGANVLLTLTNDSWWGNSVFPAWHARMASARAQECDLPVVRAATTGVSSATDRHGRLMDSTRLGDLTTLSVEVAPSARPPTLYARTGNVFVLLLCLGIAGTSVAATPRLRRPRPRHPAALPHSSRKPTTSRPRR
jgi:apolipoprotein N-acyltransferase